MSAPDPQTQIEVIKSDLEDMLYRISHDLQAPLRRIQAFSGLLARKLETIDERSQTFLDQLVADAHLAQLRVQALLRLSRVGRVWTPQTLEAHALFEEALARVPRRRNAPVLFDIGGSIQLVGDRNALLEALGALLSNASRYAEKSVALNAGREADGTWWLRISDDGPGVTHLQDEQLFQLFATDDPHHHAGLGLTVARRVMRLHGGNAVLGEQPIGGGAVFELRGPPG